MNNNYTVLHLHTEDSLLDSCTNYKLYIDKAKELGQTAIAFTEHGNIYHHLKKRMYCEENGIKYLHAIECYLTETFDEKIRDNYHTILIAKNDKGIIELNNIIANTTKDDHFYYKPRLSFDEFLNLSNNIIKLSACLASPLWGYKKKIEQLRNNGVDISNKMNMYIKLLNHYDYYEIQYHNVDEQKEYNQYLYKLSKKYNKPLVMTTDTHSLNDYKAQCRIVLKYGKTDGDWGDSENEFDLTYKSYDELIECIKEQNCLPYDVYLDAIENTNKIANMVQYSPLDISIKYPILYTDRNEEDVAWDRLRKMYKEKVDKGIIDKDDKRYIDNIKEEMRVFKKIDMIGFMLFMSEMMCYARDKGVFFSPCRGSVGGSTVAYIYDIIDIDPVKRNLMFSRFANEDRKEVGDVDIDVYEDDRPKVYDYVFNRFGKRKSSYILAMTTLAKLSVIDVIGKAFTVLAKEQGNTSIYTLDKMKEIKDEFKADEKSTREKYSELFYYYDGLEGCVVSQSMHPAGVVASPIDLIDNYSVFYNDNMQILPIDMDEVHECGLVKYDILGLRGVGIIEKTCRYANIPYPHESTMDWDDQKVFEDMAQNGINIFQFEGDYAHNTLKDYFYKCKEDGKPFTIEDMSVCNACIRPSGESYRDKLLARIPYKNPSKMIDDLFAETNGYLVYQCQTIAFLQQICGLSGSEADNIRRAIGRKQKDRLDKAMPQILDGYCNKSDKPREEAEQEAKQFLQILEDSASYQFGKNHSMGYSMLGYLLGYYRYYYPLEFCTAALNCSESDEDILNGTLLAKEKGLKIELPKFRYALNEWNFDKSKNTIYKGIGSIKNIGKTCGDNLYKLKDNHYDYFVDLLNDIYYSPNGRLANKTEITILICIDFFSEFGDINKLMNIFEIYEQYNKRKTLKKSEITNSIFLEKYIKSHCVKETDKQYSGVDMLRLLELYERDNIWNVKTTELRHLVYEIAYIGFTERIVPSLKDDIRVVISVEVNKYGTPFITLYKPSDGTTNTYKLNRWWYKEYEVVAGDTIRIAMKDRDKKIKDENGKWIDLNETEKFIENYYIEKKFLDLQNFS